MEWINFRHFKVVTYWIRLKPKASKLVVVSYPCLDDAFRTRAFAPQLVRWWYAPLCLRPPVYQSAPPLQPRPSKQWTELPMTASAILKKQCRFTMNFRVGNNEEVGVLQVLTFSKFIVDAHLHEGSSVGLLMQIHEWAVTLFFLFFSHGKVVWAPPLGAPHHKTQSKKEETMKNVMQHKNGHTW